MGEITVRIGDKPEASYMLFAIKELNTKKDCRKISVIARERFIPKAIRICEKLKSILLAKDTFTDAFCELDGTYYVPCLKIEINLNGSDTSA